VIARGARTSFGSRGQGDLTVVSCVAEVAVFEDTVTQPLFDLEVTTRSEFGLLFS
jgi:hypothetical protein